MGKENSSTAANGGKNKNKRKPFYRKKGNGGAENNTAVTKKVKELKFYLHDSAARKASESFGKIKESIILKIHKTF